MRADVNDYENRVARVVDIFLTARGSEFLGDFLCSVSLRVLAVSTWAPSRYSSFLPQSNNTPLGDR